MLVNVVLGNTRSSMRLQKWSAAGLPDGPFRGHFPENLALFEVNGPNNLFVWGHKKIGPFWALFKCAGPFLIYFWGHKKTCPFGPFSNVYALFESIF